jgi:amidase
MARRYPPTLVILMLAAGLLAAGTSAAAGFDPAPQIDKSIAELRADLDAGRTTSEKLVRAYLARIEAMDRKGPTLRAIVTVNPDAQRIARDLDRERRAGKLRGPLHGIPILLKDNIESVDAMPTTAGSLALLENFAKHDAPLVANLRAAGAIVLAKTNLSEWANFRSDRSLSGWSAVGGLTKNPHVLDRSACGSSAGSGSAVAAWYGAAAVGTETDGSITCPASMNGVVGLKPTLGLLSGQGIVPIAHSQDTAGPMTRSVSDAAYMLAAMTRCVPGQECRKADYVAALNGGALRGKRIGVLRFRPGRHPQVEKIYERALQVLRDAGATLVDTQLPENVRIRTAEETVLLTEFKTDLNAYLAGTPPQVTTRSLEQLIQFNVGNARETALFNQELFVRANATTGLDSDAYKSALADGKRLAGEEGLSKVIAAERFDLLVAPTTGPSWRIDMVSGDQFPGSFSTFPAVSGYPHLTVPMGTQQGLPVGLSFIGLPWSDALLLGAGYAYEQAAKVNVRAGFKATLESDREGALR